MSSTSFETTSYKIIPVTAIKSKTEYIVHQLQTLNIANIALLVTVLVVSIQTNDTLNALRTENSQSATLTSTRSSDIDTLKTSQSLVDKLNQENVTGLLDMTNTLYSKSSVLESIGQYFGGATRTYSQGVVLLDLHVNLIGKSYITMNSNANNQSLNNFQNAWGILCNSTSTLLIIMPYNIIGNCPTLVELHTYTGNITGVTQDSLVIQSMSTTIEGQYNSLFSCYSNALLQIGFYVLSSPCSLQFAHKLQILEII